MSFIETSHDFGYTFVFVNDSDLLTLDEYVMFDELDNLNLTSSDNETSHGSPFWKFIVPPKSKVVKHLRRGLIDKGISISYKCNHEFLKPGEMTYSIKERCAPETLTDEEIVDIIKQRGEKSTFKCPKTGNDLNIYYQAKYFNSFYAFYFENEEDEAAFEGKFTFRLDNLKLEKSDSKDENIWNINLKPKSKPVLKKILSENDKKGVSYGMSMSYYVKNQNKS